jgi:hypothetical protein
LEKNTMLERTRLFPAGLVAAAWLGMILCSAYALGVDDFGRFAAGWRMLAPGSESVTSMAWTPASRALLGLALAFQLLCLWQLRRIGATLLRQPGISPQIAAAFRWLGHGLLGLGLFGLAVPVPSLHLLPGQAYMGPERFSFALLYLVAIGCLCAYATAWLLDESVRLKRDIESFV